MSPGAQTASYGGQRVVEKRVGRPRGSPPPPEGERRHPHWDRSQQGRGANVVSGVCGPILTSLFASALSLFLMAVNIKTPVVVENITLMCLRILQKLIKPPAPTSKKNKVPAIRLPFLPPPIPASGVWAPGGSSDVSRPFQTLFLGSPGHAGGLPDHGQALQQ